MNLTTQQKAIKIAALAIISAAAFFGVYQIYFSGYMLEVPLYIALAMLLLFVFFAAFGEMVATVFKGSFEKYVIADIVPALIFIPNAAVFLILSVADFSHPEVIMPGISAVFRRNWLIFGIPVVASIIFGRFVIHRKKRSGKQLTMDN